MKLHITEKALSEIQIPQGTRSIRVVETEVTGFGAQITSTGTGAYFVAYRDAYGQRK